MNVQTPFFFTSGNLSAENARKILHFFKFGNPNIFKKEIFPILCSVKSVFTIH